MKKVFSLLALISGFTACAQKPLVNVSQNPITACGSAPHCVSSLNTDDKFITPIQFSGSVDEFQKKFTQIFLLEPRTQIVQAEGPYIHGTMTSLVFRFTDDIEFYYVVDQKKVEIKSTSRVGYYDFNTNRDRLENLRKKLSISSDLK